MKLHPQYDVTYPFALLPFAESNLFERRMLRDFISHRQHLAFRARFRKAFRGIRTLDLDAIKPFMK